LHFSPMPSLPTTDLDAAVAHINRAMEVLIRQCPAQYLWSYPRYKNPATPLAVTDPATVSIPRGDAVV